jgi:hypothetical protein
LFEIKRVERSLLGLVLNFKTNWSFLLFDSEIFFMSFSDKEKKATSKPEIRAEQINSIKTIENFKISG